MKRALQLLALTAAAAAAVGIWTIVGSGATAAARVDAALQPAAKCKHVVKRVHGKKRRVRVCSKPKPKPAPLPSAGSVVARIPIGTGARPIGLLALPGALWVTAHHLDSVFRIDPASNTIVSHVRVAEGEEQPGRMAFGNGTLYEQNYSGQTIALVDPVHNSIRSVVRAPNENCCSPAFGAGSLWLLQVGADAPDRVARFDPSGRLLTTVGVPDAMGLLFGAGSIWGSSSAKIFRLDPAANQITARIDANVVPAAYGAGSVWGLGDGGRTLVRIDPEHNAVAAQIRLPAAGAPLAATGTAVWVAEGPAEAPGSHLWKIDPATNRVVGQVKLGRTSVISDLAVGDDGSVWVSLYDANLVLRVQPT